MLELHTSGRKNKTWKSCSKPCCSQQTPQMMQTNFVNDGARRWLLVAKDAPSNKRCLQSRTRFCRQVGRRKGELTHVCTDPFGNCLHLND